MDNLIFKSEDHSKKLFVFLTETNCLRISTYDPNKENPRSTSVTLTERESLEMIIVLYSKIKL